MPMPLLSAALAVALGARPLVPAVTGASPPTGVWRWPLAGVPVVARPFEPPPGPWAAGHRGVDLAAPPETPVLAAGSGVVSFAGFVAGTGVVSVRHADGLRTTYEPVLPAVHAGDSVQGGDLLGHLMPGHGDCGPARWCLHWGLLRGSTYLDPLTLVRSGPVRLLPLPALDDAVPEAGAVPVSPTLGGSALDPSLPEAPSPGVGAARFPQSGTPPTSTLNARPPAPPTPAVGAARFPQSGTQATSTLSARPPAPLIAAVGAARFPQSGTQATSTPRRVAARRGWEATTASGAGVLAGIGVWWSTRRRSPRRAWQATKVGRHRRNRAGGGLVPGPA